MGLEIFNLKNESLAKRRWSNFKGGCTFLASFYDKNRNKSHPQIILSH